MEEGLAIEFYEPRNHQSLADKLVALLDDPERIREMALQNASAALRMSMPEVIRQYVRMFDLQQQLNGLKFVSRARKLPRWLPLRSWLARQAARRAARGSSFPLGVDLPSSDLLRTDFSQDSIDSGEHLGKRPGEF